MRYDYTDPDGKQEIIFDEVDIGHIADIKFDLQLEALKNSLPDEVYDLSREGDVREIRAWFAAHDEELEQEATDIYVAQCEAAAAQDYQGPEMEI